jgi:hypothetical protein
MICSSDSAIHLRLVVRLQRQVKVQAHEVATNILKRMSRGVCV